MWIPSLLTRVCFAGVCMQHIWMYWETSPGKEKPPYLDLCLETINRWRGDLETHVLSESTIRDYLPGLRKDAERLSLNHRSDYYRSRLVHRYGGIWLDADLIALGPLDGFFEFLGDGDVAFYGRGMSNLSANCFVGRKDSACLEDWMVEQDRIMDEGADIPWNGLGKASLVNASQRHPFNIMPVERIAPIPWQKWKWLMSRRRSPARFLEADPIVFMLYNKYLAEELAGRSKRELLEGNMLISKLFGLALGRDT